MPREIDVFQLVKTFAARNKTSVIEYAAFAQAIQRQARSYDQSDPFYRDLSLHPDGVLVPKLFQLSREARLSLQAVQNRVDRIFLPEAFTETVYAEYRRIEENPDIPFPDEDSLKLSVPPEWIQAVSVESDLPALVAQTGDRPVPLYRLVFPEGLRPVLILSVMVSGRLLEYAMLKIRNYLRKGSNKDFIHQRLAGAFSGKDRLLRDGLTSIMIRPFESVEEMRNGSGDFSYSFWAYLTTAIRKDLSSKGDPMPDDIAAHQATFIVDVYNNHYKNVAQREEERSSAFKALTQALRKPPYLYAIEDVVEFRDSQGRPLLGKYTREELEAWIQERTTQAVEGTLPELLIVGSGHAAGRLIAKETLIPYLVKGLKEARAAIKPLLTRDWRALMADFASAPAMEDDASFVSELDRRLEAFSPYLSSVLATALPTLVYQEGRGAKEPSLDLDRCFGSNRVAGADVLLDLNRKRLLADVKMLLPLWYSIPVVSWIMSLFARSAARRAAAKAGRNAGARLEEAESPGGSSAPGASNRAAEFGQMARQAEKRLVPEGQSLEDHMRTLVARWNTIIEPSAKANLTEDINSLVRDYLRTSLRSMRPSSFTLERIESMAATLADRPNLLRIRNHQALEEYIRLYIVKLLKR